MRRVLARQGVVVVTETPVPSAPHNGYLVEAEYSLVSPGTELGLISASQDGTERSLGYSLVGRVAAAGQAAQPFPPGQPVACAGYQWAWHAEYVAIPPLMATAIPDGVDPRAATFTTLGAVAMHALRQGGVMLGDRAVVVGLGVLGQLLVQLLQAAGVHAAGLDLVEERCALARRLGAELALGENGPGISEKLREWSEDLGADCVFLCTSGGDEVVSLACALARDRGRLVVVGTPPLHVPRETFFAKELTMTIARAYGPGRYDPVYEEQGVDYPVGYARWTQGRNCAEFLRLLGNGRVRVESLISHVFSVEQAADAYALLRQDPGGAMGVLFRYPQ